MDIAIIGTGSVGSTLGTRWAGTDHTVRFGTREPDREDVRELVATAGATASAAPVAEAVAASEVVVLAVPADAVARVVETAGDGLAGKPLLDATNQYPEPTREQAAYVQELTPGAHVVKAFNTVGANVMADPVFDGRAAMLPVAGDDADAKATAMGLASELGFEPFDAGDLDAAVHLEHLARFWIHLAFTGGDRAFAFGRLGH